MASPPEFRREWQHAGGAPVETCSGAVPCRVVDRARKTPAGVPSAMSKEETGWFLDGN